MKTVQNNSKINFGIVKCITALLIVIVLTACGGTNTQERDANYRSLQEVVSSKKFKIENQWAYPNGGGNINLIGNPNSIKLINDSIDIYLPYFGVRQSGGTYNGAEGGIKYKGPVKNLKIEENNRKGEIKINFEARQNSEDLDFFMTLYPNKKVRTYVILSQRTTISYDGVLKKIEEED